MDLDAFVAEHRPEWDRLRVLAKQRKLSGPEADELIALYQRSATHLSIIQSRSPDAAMVGQLSRIVLVGRAAVTGSSAPAWRDLSRFFVVTFPVAVFRAWRWWSAVSTVFTVASLALMAYVATHPDLQRAAVGGDKDIQALVDHDFASYYSENPAQSFAVHVWTNNALIAFVNLLAGILVVPVLYMLLSEVSRMGLIGGIMIGHGKGALFWGLIMPHGMLELMAVFVASGVGLRLGWSWIAPGIRRTRSQALAEEARAGAMVGLGLVCVLAVSGVIEAFVTPSGLPTWARIGIGLTAFALFHAYVFILGRRGSRAGETADLDLELRGDLVPLA